MGGFFNSGWNGGYGMMGWGGGILALIIHVLVIGLVLLGIVTMFKYIRGNTQSTQNSESQKQQMENLTHTVQSLKDEIKNLKQKD